jgi:hypothetical protein
MADTSKYDHHARPLAEAAEELTITMAEAIRELYVKLIKNPDKIDDYRREYFLKVIKAVKKWSKARQEWVDKHLPAAYQEGLKNAMAEISELRKAGIRIPEPTEGVSETVPFVGSAPPF